MPWDVYAQVHKFQGHEATRQQYWKVIAFLLALKNNPVIPTQIFIEREIMGIILTEYEF